MARKNLKVKTFAEAVRLANASGLDTAKKRMRHDGRSELNADDFDLAADEVDRIVRELGFGCYLIA